MVNIVKVNPTDFTQLQKLWSDVFHDDDIFLSAFFSELSSAATIFAAEQDGLCIGSAYVLDILTFKNGNESLPCPYIYAVGVHPEYRGQGIGKALTAACRDFCTEKYGVSCLVPASAELFDYYKNEGYSSAIYVDEVYMERQGGVKAEISSITHEKYAELRETLLTDLPHMEYHPAAIRFFARLCDIQDGDLLLMRSNDSYAIAAYECSEHLFVKELLCSDGNAQGFAASLLWHLDQEELYYRTPANKKHPEIAKAFGMLSNSIHNGPIYMGPAFD